MQRRFSTRDRRLSAQLVAALAAFYLGLTAGFVALTVSAARQGDLFHAVACLLFLAGLCFLALIQYTGAAGVTIRAVRAQREPAGDALVPEAARLAALADVPAPDVLVAHSWAPNALAVAARGKPVVIQDRPPLERRLSRLAAIAREQGRPVA